jgi:hypothetical protein
LKNHLNTISDTSVFCEIIFLRSCSLLESHGKLIEYIVQHQNWAALNDGISEAEQDDVDKIVLSGGVSTWADRLMKGTGQPWSRVYKGKKGIIEVSVMRNALMHGYAGATQHLLDRASHSGCSLPFELGEPLRIDFSLLHEYRGRIRSFCRAIGDGVVRKSRGLN